MRALLFILTIFIVFSGCIGENNVTHSNESVYQKSVNIKPENFSSTNLSSEEENIKNIPEIEITSFSSVHKHDNHEKVYDYLFSWDDVPGNETKGLISYLRDDPDINREDVTQIVKSDDNKTIHVNFSTRGSRELSVEDNRGNDLRTPDIELKVREVNGKYRVLIIPQTYQSDELEGKEVNGKLCIYKVTEKHGYNLTESYYAIYGLSIKNNGSKNLDFKLNELTLRDGNNIFNSTTEPYSRYSFAEVLSDLEKETKLEDTILSPGQTINGLVAFQVNSLYNESFLLMYNGTPINFGLFDKSVEALRTAENCNYSALFGMPPYANGSPAYESYEPDLKEYPYIWANYANRSIFEILNKADSEIFNKEVSEYLAEPSTRFLPETEFVYALKVIPERNITLHSGKTGLPKDNFIVIDDTGEELINTSRVGKIALLKNQTYELHSEESMDITQMNLSNVTIVRISFYSLYTWGRITIVNQDAIMDREQNIVVASNDGRQFQQ